MPEKMTKEEAIIAMAIKKARHAKSMLHESTQIMPYDHEVEMVKIKRPKAQNVKIKNQTQKKEGYGLAGETFKKQDKMVSVSRDLLKKIEMEISRFFIWFVIEWLILLRGIALRKKSCDSLKKQESHIFLQEQTPKNTVVVGVSQLRTSKKNMMIQVS